ncbi:GNAT family N-acetyltransferase [Pedobacter nyackensis]|uniref:Protein N-acetyltransferase, RimJ/RimL family n=1 Tax=Pedobacter nyackensis TaxID=475255 RepID=A0A1W2DDQ5_9SPHI|nr:GNAT family N-acetyltransferase [Pedobacter nyackensis]SMC95216.1 Protein N-acetyltransferase, RimJ/RimL family [Pedobacter nyackensis]
MNYSVYLRPLALEDAETAYKWRNNPNIWVYTKHPINQYVTLEIERNWISEVSSRTNEKRFAICLTTDNQYIGNVQLTNIQESSATYHIFIGEESFWGKGIAKLATSLILEYAFFDMKLDTIFLDVHVENKAAQGIYKEKGFKVINDQNDFIDMSLTRETFLKNRDLSLLNVH